MTKPNRKQILKNFRKGLMELNKGYKILYKETDIDDDEMEKLQSAIKRISEFY